MSTENIASRTDNTTIYAEHVNIFKRVLGEDLVPRNTSGVATNAAGDCGTDTYRWDNVRANSGLFFGSGATQDSIEHSGSDIVMKLAGVVKATLTSTGFNSASIQDLAITTAKINDLAVTNGKLAANAVTAAKISAGTITATELATNSVGSDEIAANAVTNSEIAAATVIQANMAANSVGTSQIIDSNVTYEKIEDVERVSDATPTTFTTSSGDGLEATGHSVSVVAHQNRMLLVTLQPDGANNGYLRLTSTSGSAGDCEATLRIIIDGNPYITTFKAYLNASGEITYPLNIQILTEWTGATGSITVSASIQAISSGSPGNCDFTVERAVLTAAVV